MIIYKNEEKLKKFVEKYLKQPYNCYDIEAVKEEVWSSYCSGGHAYEISQFESVDGQTHCLDFTVTLKNDDIIIEF